MTDFTPARLAELRAVAEAATQGEWRATEPQEWGDDEKLQSAVMVSEGETLTWDDHGGEVFHPADATFIATFDPPTVTGLIAALEAKTAEVERVRETLAETAARNWGRAQKAEAAREELQGVLERIKDARANHPECDKYDEDSPVVCGWKRTVQSIDAALQTIQGADDA